jgi:hypothetical protein
VGPPTFTLAAAGCFWIRDAESLEAGVPERRSRLSDSRNSPWSPIHSSQSAWKRSSRPQRRVIQAMARSSSRLPRVSTATRRFDEEDA